MDQDSMPLDLAKALHEHSPRLVISAPALLRYPSSPTGWLVIEPRVEEPAS